MGCGTTLEISLSVRGDAWFNLCALISPHTPGVHIDFSMWCAAGVQP